MNSFFRENLVALIAAAISFVSMYAVDNYRLNTLSDRQDRQRTAITAIQDQITTQATNYAALSAKLDALGDNVLCIRNRIDSAVK